MFKFPKKNPTKFIIGTTQNLVDNKLPLLCYYTGYPFEDINSCRQIVFNAYIENAITCNSKKYAKNIALKLQKKIGGVYIILELV